MRTMVSQRQTSHVSLLCVRQCLLCILLCMRATCGGVFLTVHCSISARLHAHALHRQNLPPARHKPSILHADSNLVSAQQTSPSPSPVLGSVTRSWNVGQCCQTRHSVGL
ncbi:hypothetical protein P154DRAFT_142746 [Amniculicola lignicola CBS 123094]|uniref:Uncharacterized protein n=1 Tax=Amniculicola lignicola CBS 123094 TaxID=1392246 RepID=A0A6A5WK58_9PLEO|nr:hypothetical protein P154DRAFT_142746 [Amniculicola lignicola CBS 123094]